MNSSRHLDTDQPRRKAYSYVRFSTPEQEKGDSFRRQAKLASDYAAAHGLELDDTLVLHDLGRSGYRGANLLHGNLGRFIEHVRSGEVPQGSLLLVESLDRITRQDIGEAQYAFLGLLRSGVDVVTLIDGQEYSWTHANSPAGMTQLLISLTILSRANDESRTKAHRLTASWANKRDQAALGLPITSRLPAWLRLSDDRQRIEQIPERAELVRRMFLMTLEGIGQHRIAETFNRERIELWGPGKSKATMWHRSYIKKTLENPAVIGTYLPHVVEYEGSKKRRRPLEPILDYFPKIITDEVFRDVQAIRDVQGGAARGRHATAPITNVLARLAACPRCGSAMTRVNKGKRSKPAFVCTKAKSGAGCKYQAMAYAVVERSLIFGLPERLRVFEGVAGRGGLDDAVEAASARIDLLSDAIASKRRKVGFLLDDLTESPSPAVSRRIRELDAELEVALQELQRLVDQQEQLTGKTIGVRIEKALAALEPDDGEPSPAAVNVALRSLFKRAVIDWDGHEVGLEWSHGGVCRVPLFNTFISRPGPGWLLQDHEEQASAADAGD